MLLCNTFLFFSPTTHPHNYLQWNCLWRLVPNIPNTAVLTTFDVAEIFLGSDFHRLGILVCLKVLGLLCWLYDKYMYSKLT